MNEETLFELALNTPPTELPALLDRECANDPKLRSRIEKLLAAHLSPDLSLTANAPFAGDQHDPSGSATSVSPSRDQILGATLGGKYKLIELIGDGGMGSVYMAHQAEPVKRLVAVKVIKAGMDSKAVLARFEAERQALAMMDHPNIAKVLDAGSTDTGSPYFVMELVKGIPITKFCDENKLTPRQRLELFLPVCEAIQHSHQKGIIHRDIKPSNVLVAMYDERAVPKVIDFGVAKATGQSLSDVEIVTGFGALVGTPEYMSPEQAGFNNLDIDTRTDVYSLGVLLYELLSGHTPVDRKSLGKAALYEILRIVRDVDAPLLSAKLSSIDTLGNVAANRRTEPRKLATQFRGEIDWVLHKALEKDRARRYATANSLARDIQRYLSNEIVEARPPSTFYTLQKLYRRNKGQVLAACLLLLSLVAGIVGTTWGFLRAEQRRVQAVIAQGQEAIQRGVAESEKLRAIDSRNRALEALRATTGEDVEKLLGEKKVLSQNERAYLEAIANRWQLFSSQTDGDQLSRAISGEGHFRVANLWDRLGRREDALLKYEQAETVYRELKAEFPDEPSYTENLAVCCSQAGMVLNHLGRRDEALAKLRDGLVINKRLVETFPDESGYQSLLAGCYHNLAIVSEALGDQSEAFECYKQGMEIEERLVTVVPNQAEFRRRLATSHSNLGALLVSMGKHAEAQEQYEKGLTIREKLATDFPEQVDYRMELATSYNNYANLLSALGQPEAALDRYQKAVAIKQRVFASYPGVPEYASSLANSYKNLGSELKSQGMNREAISTFRQALAINEKLASEFPFEPEYRQDLASIYHSLANLSRDNDHLELANELHRKAIVIREKLTNEFAADPEYRRNLASSHISFGQLLRKQDNPKAAEESYRIAVTILEKLYQEFPGEVVHADNLASSYNSLANLLADKGVLEQALEKYQQAIKIRENLAHQFPAIPEYRVDLAGVYANVGNKKFESNHPDDSLEWYAKAIDLLSPIHESATNTNKASRYLEDCYEGQSRALDKLNRFEEGERIWDRYVAMNSPKSKYLLLIKRWKRLIRQGMVKESIDRIAEYAQQPSEEGGLWYELACAYALASDRSPENQVEYADRAMELLKRAGTLGYDDTQRIRRDSDLKSLRDREDFKSFIAQMESDAAARNGPQSPTPPSEPMD